MKNFADDISQFCDNSELTQVVKNSSERKDDNIIKGIAGLSKFLSIGATKAQAILNSEVLQHEGIAYNAGGWRIYKDKLEEFIKKNPTLLERIKCPH